MMRPLVITTALLSAALSQERTTYDDHVFPIFQQACLNCHNPDKTKGGLDLSSYSATMKGSSGGKIAEPGETGSTLISVVRQTTEPKMPPEGDKLSNEQIQILTRWIETGLLENASSSVRKPSKPKFKLSPGTDPNTRPDGPPPMPQHLLLEPVIATDHASAVRAMAASPWAPLLAVTSQRQVLLHHTESLELVGILPFPEGDPVSLSFTPDGRHLMVGGGIPGKSGLTVTFDITNGSPILSVGREFDSVLAADIRPGFDIVATGSPSRLLKLWNTSSGESLASIKKHTDWITALDISPDGVLLASGDRNGGVWVWESATASEFHTLRAHQAAITAVTFRSDSNILATSSEDGTLRFWEMNGGTEIKKSDAHPGGVTAFSFARDGSSLSTGRDLKAKLWKPDFTLARELSPKLPALPTAAALDADAERAFIADTLGTIRVFNTENGKPLGEFPNNPPAVSTRLATLETRINHQKKHLATLDRRLNEQTARLLQSREALAVSEQALRQAVKIHQAAQDEAGRKPDGANHKIASEALSRIAPAEKSVQELRSALTSTQKSHAESSEARNSAKAVLSNLITSRKHWTAAAINTHLLNTHQLADAAAATSEKTLLSFTEAASQVTRQAEILNAKRHQRARFAALLDAPQASPETRSEIQLTLPAIDLIIARLLQSLRQSESALEETASTIGPATRLAHQRLREAESLQTAYENALNSSSSSE